MHKLDSKYTNYTQNTPSTLKIHELHSKYRNYIEHTQTTQTTFKIHKLHSKCTKHIKNIEIIFWQIISVRYIHNSLGTTHS